MVNLNKISALFLFFISFLALSAHAADNAWQSKYNQDGITVDTRPVAGSQLLEFKADMVLAAPLSKIIPIFEDEKILNTWFYQCIQAKLLKDEGSRGKILYLVFHLPWPVTERDTIFRRIKTIDPATSSVNFSIEALPDYLPTVKGKVRVLSIKSHWRFTPLPDGRTEIFFQQHCNPGGFLPPFLVNALAVDTPTNSFKALRKLILEESHE